MKKALSVILSLALVLMAGAVGVHAEREIVSTSSGEIAEPSIHVRVTIVDENGTPVVAAEEIAVSEIGDDSTLTINDVLYTAHEQFYDGGAAAGYGTSVSEYGLGLIKLWGSTCGSYGYYVNNNSAWALSDPVADGDYVAAFVYTDTQFWTDHYTYFTTVTGKSNPDEDFSLTLCEVDYDTDWNPVAKPLAGAVITVDGEATGFVTDAEGQVTLALTELGTHLISAKKEGKRIVAPVYIDTVLRFADVCVTIADQEGNTAVVAEPITVTDVDADGVLTINDTLYIAHEMFYDGGAAAGYGASVSEYGLGLTKLWGSTCGSYGYYVNNNSAWSLADPVKKGDYVAAFVYTDTQFWTDHYSYFTEVAGKTNPGEAITLTFMESAYDDDWNPIAVPVEGAVITVDGKATEFVTDAQGQVTLALSDIGVHIISAEAEGKRLVAPVYIAAVELFADVYVTIADKDRVNVVSAEKVYVTDLDKDEALTVNDVLVAAHDAFYPGGAAEGYANNLREDGLRISKLWGTLNFGSFANFLNNAPCRLADTVRDGDYVAAFIYTDYKKCEDRYAYFDQLSYTTTEGMPVVVSAHWVDYDESGNPVVLPLGVTLLALDGEEILIETLEDGTAVIPFLKAGSYRLSISPDDGSKLVLPVATLEVKAGSRLIGDADGNGKIEIIDATHIQRYLAALVKIDEINIANANADRTGDVTILDATAIQRYLAGIVKEL